MRVTESRLVGFIYSCRYSHKMTLKPTTRIAVELIDHRLIMHRFPRWMPVSVHICLEKVIRIRLRHDVLKKVYVTWFVVPHHIFHGLICDYSMRDIIRFIRRQLNYSIRRE